nr:hypothetical protein [Tanacetum cinerariifolium]
NKRTRVIMESIHVNFDELPQMASVHISSDPAPEYKTGTTSNKLDLLFSPMFDELLNGSSKVVSKSSAVSAADAPNERHQYTTPLNNHTTPAPTCQNPSIASSVISNENINQAELNAENDQVADDEFINIFSTPLQDQRETSSRHVDSSNMHTFYQCYPSEQRWTKDHPLEQVIGQHQQYTTPLHIHTTPAPTHQTPTLAPSFISYENINQEETYAETDQVADDETRRKLESDAEMCMFALT